MIPQEHPLRAARKAQNLSMRELAQQAGLGEYGHRRIYGWERGETIPTLPYARLLASVLHAFQSGEELRTSCRQWKDEQPHRREEGSHAG